MLLDDEILPEKMPLPLSPYALKIQKMIENRFLTEKRDSATGLLTATAALLPAEALAAPREICKLKNAVGC